MTLLVAGLWWLFAGDGPEARRRPPSRATGSPSGGWTRLLRNRDLLLVTGSFLALDYFEYLFFYWMQYYFDTVLKLGVDTSRRYSTIVSLAMASIHTRSAGGPGVHSAHRESGSRRRLRWRANVHLRPTLGSGRVIGCR